MVYIQNLNLLSKESLTIMSPDEIRGIAKSNERYIATLVKSGSVPPRIENITYEYLNKTNNRKSYISSVHTFSSQESCALQMVADESTQNAYAEPLSPTVSRTEEGIVTTII